jgi:DNA repair protein RadC
MLTKRYGIREENSPAYKAVSGGAVSLSNEELLSLVVSGHKESAKALAEALLNKYNLKQLSVLDISTLIIDFKMSALKSAQMAACFELSRRLEAFQVEQKPKISSPEDVYRRIYPMLREQKKEFFILLCLDTKNQIIRQETISIEVSECKCCTSARGVQDSIVGVSRTHYCGTQSSIWGSDAELRGYRDNEETGGNW